MNWLSLSIEPLPNMLSNSKNDFGKTPPTLVCRHLPIRHLAKQPVNANCQDASKERNPDTQELADDYYPKPKLIKLLTFIPSNVRLAERYCSEKIALQLVVN